MGEHLEASPRGSREDGQGADRWGGRVRAGRGELVPARFAWHDPESGERLLVDFEGSEGFFRELEALGFVRQPLELADDEDPDAAEAPRAPRPLPREPKPLRDEPARRPA